MEKIKLKIENWLESSKGKDILTIIIIILVGLGSFGLGKLSSKGSNKDSGIMINYGNQSANSANLYNANLNKTQKIFFASKKGRKYYPINCPAGKSIKKENKIYFSNENEAKRAGYELSNSCK